MHVMKRPGLFALFCAAGLAVAIAGTVIGDHAHAVEAQSQFKMVNDPNSLTYLASQAGVLPLYNPDGTPITGGKCVQSIVQSTTSGTWSMDYTAMGFTKITSFRADAANPNTSGLFSSQYFTSRNPPSLTVFSGSVTMTTSVTILSIAVPIMSFASTAVPVSVGVCGQ